MVSQETVFGLYMIFWVITARVIEKRTLARLGDTWQLAIGIVLLAVSALTFFIMDDPFSSDFWIRYALFPALVLGVNAISLAVHNRRG